MRQKDEDKQKPYFLLGDVKNFDMHPLNYEMQSEIILKNGEKIYSPNLVGELRHEFKKHNHAKIQIFLGKGIHYNHDLHGGFVSDLIAERIVAAVIDSSGVKEVNKVNGTVWIDKGENVLISEDSFDERALLTAAKLSAEDAAKGKKDSNETIMHSDASIADQDSHVGMTDDGKVGHLTDGEVKDTENADSKEAVVQINGKKLFSSIVKYLEKFKNGISTGVDKFR